MINLGLTTLALNPIAFNFGPIQVHWYGIIIATGVVLALILSVREGRRRGIDEDYFYDYLLWALPVAIICARFYYVAFQWPYYSQHPGEIIAIWDGGIAIYGAIIGGVLTLYFFCRARQISMWTMMDVISPTLIMAQGIGRWGNFMNQEAFGTITTRAALVSQHIPEWIINQMYIGNHYRVPTFLYESLWDLTGFVLLLLLRHRRHLFKRGEVFLTYVMWYSFGRFFIEGMRTDSLMIGSVIRVSQVLSLILFVVAVIILIARRQRTGLPWYVN
ncbi:prolipoprotein diacylglyceryl transferase [Limosilactobacillus fastidiosus]|uniref:Phosphatidylglycerol--prolipoprotein diacylglyceryl transferase n=1 Tax=Limosilactobacillus fastidiosus TaxID=2759855 RepID=A0A7W3U007_9LACO|nr:prolipoprotein diacylglyceryl transferase [Limosilactobacillus fastidiosus]MBB1063239.1 prolipoprotein diacylglyceryl transferase [Limosilactobacillus fastidiosus]MBB1086120.1 prolipoprotein diacylglyceryl transferase [Limosilactobacillus fastidiosus]MCD7084470.1 prolipoprotein diacylglyceryl transferase [Limosilactobacillus fastidiosus]MCD7085035.1 prolipoprotein diacylglyceryl transferase [Limosilactobacillus fastidiosus]MCD7114547.1 prolipoprotein diacylglyceryl transferase [Limosilactob